MGGVRRYPSRTRKQGRTPWKNDVIAARFLCVRRVAYATVPVARGRLQPPRDACALSGRVVRFEAPSMYPTGHDRQRHTLVAQRRSRGDVADRRRRAGRARSSGGILRRARVRRRCGRRRAGGTDARDPARDRSRAGRPAHARRGWLESRAPPARAPWRHRHRDAHLRIHGGGSHRGARNGRRRLCAQAVRPA